MTDAQLTPLLEVQALDLSARAAQVRASELPERERLRELAQDVARLEAERRETQVERERLEAEEVTLGEQVAALVKEIEAADVARYSAKRPSRDEVAEHDAAQAKRRANQSEFEEQEMALLEAIEEVDTRDRALAERIADVRREAGEATARIRAVEADVSAEIERIGAARSPLVAAIPSDVLKTYEHVRDQQGKAGYGATELGEGSCGRCKIKLPSLEYRHMREAEAGTLLQCPQCRRVLVRT